jgi:hypothetical protein
MVFDVWVTANGPASYLVTTPLLTIGRSKFHNWLTIWCNIRKTMKFITAIWEETSVLEVINYATEIPKTRLKCPYQINETTNLEMHVACSKYPVLGDTHS